MQSKTLSLAYSGWVKYSSEGGYAPGDTWELCVGTDHIEFRNLSIMGVGQVHKQGLNSCHDVGRLQEGWASICLNRSPRHGGRQAGASFLFECFRQGDRVRRLDESAVES